MSTLCLGNRVFPLTEGVYFIYKDVDASLTVSTMKDAFRTIVDDLQVLICCSSDTTTVTDLGHQTKLNSTLLCPFTHHKIEDTDHIVVSNSDFTFKNSSNRDILNFFDNDIYNISTQVECEIPNTQSLKFYNPKPKLNPFDVPTQVMENVEKTSEINDSNFNNKYDDDSTDIDDDIIATENIIIEYDRKEKRNENKLLNPFVLLKRVKHSDVESYKMRKKSIKRKSETKLESHKPFKHLQNTVNCSEEIVEIFSKTCNSNNDYPYKIDRCNPLLKVFKSTDSEILHNTQNTEDYVKSSNKNNSILLTNKDSTPKKSENPSFKEIEIKSDGTASDEKSFKENEIEDDIESLPETQIFDKDFKSYSKIISPKSPFFNCTQDLKDVLSSQEQNPKCHTKLNNNKKLDDHSELYAMPQTKKLKKHRTKKSSDTCKSPIKNNQENALYNTQQLVDIFVSQDTSRNENIVNENDYFILSSSERSPKCRTEVNDKKKLHNRSDLFAMPETNKLKKHGTKKSSDTCKSPIKNNQEDALYSTQQLVDIFVSQDTSRNENDDDFIPCSPKRSPKCCTEVNDKKKLHDRSVLFAMPGINKLKKHGTKKNSDTCKSPLKNNQENALYNTQQLVDIFLSQDISRDENIVNENDDDFIPCSPERSLKCRTEVKDKTKLHDLSNLFAMPQTKKLKKHETIKTNDNFKSPLKNDQKDALYNTQQLVDIFASQDTSRNKNDDDFIPCSPERSLKCRTIVNKKKSHIPSNLFVMPQTKGLKKYKTIKTSDTFRSPLKNDQGDALYNTQQLVDIFMSQDTSKNEKIVNADDFISCPQEEYLMKDTNSSDVSSISSDSDVCQRMIAPPTSTSNEHNFFQIELPDSQEIKQCINNTKYNETIESSPDSSSDEKTDSDPPVVFKRKLYNKKKNVIKKNKSTKTSDPKLKSKNETIQINDSASTSLRVSGRKIRRSQHCYKIMLSSKMDDPKWNSIVKNLGGTVVDTEGDVLVVSCMRRTVKTLLALSQQIPIVSSEWLKKSFECCRFLDPMQFLFIDEQFEKKYKFNYKSMLKSQKKHFLSGWTVYLTSNIDINLEEMKQLIETNDGVCIVGENSHRNKNKQAFTISCTNDIPILKDFPKPHVTIETILSGILYQKLDLKSNILKTK